MSSVHRCVVKFCPLGYRAKRLQGWGPQAEVAVTARDDELGLAGAWRRSLLDSGVGRCPVRLLQQRVAVVRGGSGKPEWVLGVLSVHAQAVLNPSQGHLGDCFRCTYGDSRGLLAVDTVNHQPRKPWDSMLVLERALLYPSGR